ncbi:MAG: hypothetical protein WC586_03650 [Methanoregula sp.]
MKGGNRSESGYLYGFLFVFLAVIVFSLVLFSIFIPMSYFSGQEASSSMNALTDNLALVGSVTGYGGMPVNPQDYPALKAAGGYSGLAGARLSIRLASLRLTWATGTGDDLTRAIVVVTTPQGSETLPMQESSASLPRPGWAIVSKNGILPGTSANQNNILEPNELFTILISPSENIPPGTPFTIAMNMPDVQPLSVNRMVPGQVKAVMDLG